MTHVRQQLLDAENSAWHELETRLHKLGDEDWLRPGVNGEWNAKDLLHHITAWLAVTTDRFESFRMTGELPGHPDVDVFNQEQYERGRDISLHDVRVMSGASRHRFREELQKLPPDPDDHIQQIVHGNADGHYEEHIAHLDAFLGRA